MVIFFYCLRPLSRLFKRVHSSHVAAIIAFRVINQLSFAASEETQRLPFVFFAGSVRRPIHHLRSLALSRGLERFLHERSMFNYLFLPFPSLSLLKFTLILLPLLLSLIILHHLLPILPFLPLPTFHITFPFFSTTCEPPPTFYPIPRPSISSSPFPISSFAFVLRI